MAATYPTAMLGRWSCCLLLAACAPDWAWRHDQPGPPPCPSLKPSATRADLEAELGPPQREFFADHVVMWHLVEQDGRGVAVPRSRDPKQPRAYTMVVEFGLDGTVRRWSVVEAL